MDLNGGQQHPVQVAAAQHQRVVQPVAEVGQGQLQQDRSAGIPDRGGWGAPGGPLQLRTQPKGVQHGQPVGLQQDPGADRGRLGHPLQQPHGGPGRPQQQRRCHATDPATGDHHPAALQRHRGLILFDAE
jgi:hypothetical protein